VNFATRERNSQYARSCPPHTVPDVEVSVEEEGVEGGGDPLGVRVAALRAGGQVHGCRVAVGVHSGVRSSQMKEEIY
jgi:hypothetical protein